MQILPHNFSSFCLILVKGPNILHFHSFAHNAHKPFDVTCTLLIIIALVMMVLFLSHFKCQQIRLLNYIAFLHFFTNGVCLLEYYCFTNCNAEIIY